MRSKTSTLNRLFAAIFLVVLCVTAASAQSDWVGQFLHRYRPPLIDPSARVTPEVSDAAFRQMVRTRVEPVPHQEILEVTAVVHAAVRSQNEKSRLVTLGEVLS